MISQTTLRQLDRLIGVPLCTLLSLVRHLRLSPRATPPPPKRVLLIQLAESGSMVLAAPAMHQLQQNGIELYCLTLEETRPALAVTATINPSQIYTLGTGTPLRLFIDIFRLRRWIRAQQIDSVIDLELFTRLSALLSVWSGVNRRVGFTGGIIRAPYRGQLYSHPVAYNPHIHIAKNYLLLVQALSHNLRHPQQPRPHIADHLLTIQPRLITPQEVADCHQRLEGLMTGAFHTKQPLILMNPNASNRLPQRRWPTDSFVTLTQRLLAHASRPIILLIGADEDRHTTAAIHAQVEDPHCLDTAGLFPLSLLPALFTLSRLMISNDSGPAHFAAVTAMPVLTLFGPETPQLYRPLGPGSVITAGLSCSPCVSAANQRQTRCQDNRCMQLISVEQVSTCATRMLEGHTQASIVRSHSRHPLPKGKDKMIQNQ